VNGPQHYRAAEALLEAAEYPQRWVTGLAEAELEKATGVLDDDAGTFDSGHIVAAAQAHATLALVAANVNSYCTEAGPDWSEVLS
jgi:hypothetical protein